MGGFELCLNVKDNERGLFYEVFSWRGWRRLEALNIVCLIVNNGMGIFGILEVITNELQYSIPVYVMDFFFLLSIISEIA
jgi:hypothetical protein